MKEFNLTEYLKNPSQKVVTRDGRAVRIICTDHKGSQPIIALVTKNEKEDIQLYFSNGKWTNQCESNLDLFFATITKEGWVNIYKGVNEKYPSYLGQSIYKSEEEALKNKCNDKYITTIKIEWEE